ncbi:DNA translocase FtsK [Streptosporangium sp. NPDC049078]|uniref:DNA translocase FtsK n=1 Tax=Streptosporangium sp. NPDC049078 TaxID=3155767 RepID=UPI0034333D31
MAATKQVVAPAPPDASSWEQVATREVSKALLYFPPWAVAALLFGIGSAFHTILRSDDPKVVAWTTALITVCVMGLTGLTWNQSHARSTVGRLHTTLTTLAGGLWVCAATINGPTSMVTGRLILIGGVSMALSFNIRTVIRQKQIDVQGAVNDPLKFLFGQGATAAGMPAIEARTTKATEHKVEGAVQLEQGRQTADDLQKKLPYVESGIGLPPGSITTSIDPDDASKAKVVISDPRVMKNPIPWPGPSRPGASITDPIRIGLWQDLDQIEYVIVGHHVQVMGKTGSGKSIGGAWNFLAEAVSRVDVAVFAIDITKGDQTLGPLRPALHRLETTKEGARALLNEMQSQVKKRTDQLAAKRLQKWKEGCGLTYWILWLEEFPDIFDALTDKEQERFLSLVKAIRSAGGTVVLSLQRSDYTQMPTIARGQLAKMCFGVDSSADASFGLSEAQDDAGCRPELWSNKQPGMAYLDAPSIPDERIAMPLRTYAWGMAGGTFDDERANAALAAHAAAYPAAYKKVDAGTAALARLDASALASPAPLPVLETAPVDVELLAQAAELVVTTQLGSASMLQRKLRIPFAQAQELIAELRRRDVLGPPREGKAPAVLRQVEELREVLAAIRDEHPSEADGVDDEGMEAVAAEYQTISDPDPTVQAGLDDEIPDLDEGEPPWKFAAPDRKMTAEERGAALMELLHALWDDGARDFSSGALKPLWEQTDISRAWVQDRLKRLVDAGVLSGYDDEVQRYLMTERPKLP